MGAVITASELSWIAPYSGLSPKQFGKRSRFRRTVQIVDGTLVPTRDDSVAEQSKNYPYSTNHQAVIDADSHLVAFVGRPVPGNRNDCKPGDLSGAKSSVATPP